MSVPAVDLASAHQQARARQAELEVEVAGPLAAAWLAIEADVTDVQSRWPALAPAGRIAALTVLARTATSRMRSVEGRTRRVVPRVVADVYATAAGTAAVQAGARYAPSRIDAGFAGDLARDLLADLQQAIGFVETTARSMARDLSVLAHRDPSPRDLQQALRERGVTAVVYRDGSRHGLDDYARMAVRTKLAQAWQVAALRFLRSVDVGWVEIVDGRGCGWRSHQDPLTANGRIITVDEALAVPTAHPNCVRSSFPRLDITSAEQAAAADPTVPAPFGDGESAAPSVRTVGGLLDIRAPQLLSVAAARHATLAARAGHLAGHASLAQAALRTPTRMRTPVTGPGTGSGSGPAGSG